MDIEEFNKFMNDLKTLVLEHPIVADWWAEISGRKNIADAVERNHGEWVWVADSVEWDIGAWCCSECQSRNDNIPHYPKTNPLIWHGTKYCANCGADMRGQKNE